MVRKRVVVKGIVQGVGFRPFIWRIANEHNLVGWVKNTTSGVVIEVQGKGEDIDAFIRDIVDKKPPLALIADVETKSIPTVEGEETFKIIRSSDGKPSITIIPPDVAVCKDCLREMFDPTDRRYRYPYINCTNCGPRFTIIKDVPYDRDKTTMADWKMCDKCRAEYEDPADRRFHAQPVACPECGPTYFLTDMMGNKVEGDPFKMTAKLLREGYIVAIKSLGGYNLAVDATNEEAVKKLRKRKKRPTKPFAIMVKDLRHIEDIVRLSPEAKQHLTSHKAPILLLPKYDDNIIAESVAPGQNRLGVFLPYTPVHHLLFHDGAPPYLVMTSANVSGERIIYTDEEAYAKLSDIADFILVGQREIHAFIDDSVGTIFEGEYYHIRRARGFVPYPIFLDVVSDKVVISSGADMKGAFGIFKGGYAILSQYLGDLEAVSNGEGYRKMLRHFMRLFQVDRVDTLVIDRHPMYFSRQYALQTVSAKEVIEIYHHHGHALSVMAEYGKRRAIGLIMDGTGYGKDGTIWGSEMGMFDIHDFDVMYHFEPVPLVGGDIATREVWRLKKAFLNVIGEDSQWLRLISSSYVPYSRGMGRIFDTLSAILNIVEVATYEAEPAIMLQQYAERSGDTAYYRYSVSNGKVSTFYILSQAYREYKSGVPREVVARRFHNTIANVLVDVAVDISKKTGIKAVALSGGVWQNLLLLEMVVNGLRKRGLEPLIHRQVSPSDEGISLGFLYYGLNIGREE